MKNFAYNIIKKGKQSVIVLFLVAFVAGWIMTGFSFVFFLTVLLYGIVFDRDGKKLSRVALYVALALPALEMLKIHSFAKTTASLLFFVIVDIFILQIGEYFKIKEAPAVCLETRFPSAENNLEATLPSSFGNSVSKLLGPKLLAYNLDI